MIDKHKLLNSEPFTPEKFANPSREFGSLPFWFVNGEMDYDEMEYQLKEFHAKGIPGIFFHARFGIKDYMPYLGNEWFKRIKFTIEKCNEIGLQIWAYDDYNWPSGSVGQTIQKEDDELTEVYLQLLEGDLPGQFFSFMEGTDSRYNDLEESEPVYCCAIKLEHINEGKFEYVDLTPSLSFDKVLTWEAPKGPWKQMYFIERKASWYTDVLNPETTKRFIEKTHEKYKKEQGGKFKDTDGMQGFYIDEPAMLYFEAGKDNYIIPWSKKIFKFFKEKNGYDLRRNLPKLFYNVGDDYEKIRHDFWRTLSDQYDEVHFKAIGDWCKANNTIFTGHLLHEESLRMHAKSGGNLFQHLKHMDLTGVDHLYPRIGTREMPNEHVALKIASSAAHHFGSTRLLCESMGGAYWDCTMERQKWIADWEYVLGVNLFNPHGGHYTIEGERKRDWPPSQFYHHTWWEYYGLFIKYLSRMGYVLTGGRHVCKIAMIYPIHSIWANFTPQKADAISKVIENDFVWFTDRLLRVHADFDYIDEDVLAECKIIDGKIIIQDEAYELLILPPMTHIKQSTIEKLEQFRQSGGKFITSCLLPYKTVDGEPIHEILGTNPAELRERFLQGKETGWAVGNDIEALKNAIFSKIIPDITIDSEEVFYLHREKDEHQFYFIINPTDKEIFAHISIEGEYTPEFWNLENGTNSPILPYTTDTGRTFFTLNLAPYGSALVGAKNPPNENNDKYFPPKDLIANLNFDNNFNITLNKPNTYITGDYTLNVKEHTLPFGMGAWEMQLPFEWEGGYPVELKYKAEINADFVPADILLMIDGFKGKKYTIHVNGKKITTKPRRSYLDAQIKTVSIKNQFLIGKNEIIITITAAKKSDGLVDLLKIIGSFAVEDGVIKEPVTKLNLGDWVNQGLPYYSGGVIYETTINIADEYIGKEVLFNADVGTDVLELWINDEHAGVRLWQPYKLSVGELLKSGENNFKIKVTNTLANMLNASKQASGLFSCGLEIYNK